MNDSLKIKTLREMAARVTQNNFALPEQSFTTDINVSLDSEIIDIRITFYQGKQCTWYEIDVCDKTLKKTVSLTLWSDGEIHLFTRSLKIKRTWKFWQKPKLVTVFSNYDSEFCLDVDKSNEYVQFLWDRIPKSLLEIV